MNTSQLLTMKTFGAAIAAFALVGCNSIAVRGSGSAFEVTHELGDVTEVVVNGTGELRIQNGDADQLIVTAQDEIHEHLIIRQQGDRLIIEPRDGYHFKTDKELRYVLITNNLSLLDVSGAVDVTANEYRTQNLLVDASGSTDLDISIYADTLKIDAAGAFDGYLSGDVSDLILDFSGASDINSYDLNARNVDINLSGAGTAFVTATERLNVSAAGASNVTYKGNPRVSQSSAGASSVNSAD
jgi:hypothetical protein